MISKNGFTSLDFIFFIITIFVFGIIAILSYSIFQPLNEDIQNDDQLSDLSKETSNDLFSRFPATLDGLFAALLGLLYIAIMVISYFSDSHPIWIFIIFIVMIFVMLAGASLSNAYAELSDESELSVTQGQFPIINFVNSNLVLVIGGIVTSIMIVIGLRNYNG